MVHALHNAVRVLRAGGLIIDIHPLPARDRILCETSQGRVFVGLLKQSLQRYRAAEDRLGRTADRGLFRLLRSAVFSSLYHCTSVKTLETYLAQEWTDASLDSRTVRRIHALASPKGRAKVLVEERVRISVFEKLPV